MYLCIVYRAVWVSKRRFNKQYRPHRSTESIEETFAVNGDGAVSDNKHCCSIEQNANARMQESAMNQCTN